MPLTAEPLLGVVDKASGSVHETSLFTRGDLPTNSVNVPVSDDGGEDFFLDSHFTSVCDPHKTNDVKSFCGETLDIVSVGKVDLRLPVSEECRCRARWFSIPPQSSRVCTLRRLLWVIITRVLRFKNVRRKFWRLDLVLEIRRGIRQESQGIVTTQRVDRFVC